MVDTIAARDVLHSRLEAVFSDGVMASYAPGVHPPEVFLGLPVTEPHCYVAVDEMPSNIATSGSVSMGHATVEFDLSVYVFAQHKDAVTAANTVQGYVLATIDAVLADHTLCMTVDNSMPSVSQSGCAADSSKRYMAAAVVTITCTAYSNCPQEIKEAVDAASGN